MTPKEDVALMVICCRYEKKEEAQLHCLISLLLRHVSGPQLEQIWEDMEIVAVREGWVTLNALLAQHDKENPPEPLPPSSPVSSPG